ncbi:hypothetical protein HK096_001714 [Nowakowskiella sp. JEL0078]|nr:hypothetical protein HK096_001714 [Nowakowskiella sp. JEL0078]
MIKDPEDLNKIHNNHLEVSVQLLNSNQGFGGVSNELLAVADNVFGAPVSIYNASKWDDALEWIYATYIPSDVKIVNTCFVFDEKFTDTGNIKKKRGHWVMKGFQQHPGIDYGDISVLVAPIELVWLTIVNRFAEKAEMFVWTISLCF